MRYYKITKNNINNNDYWTRIVNDIRNSLSKVETLEDKILVIRLQDVANDDTSLIPKLEFREQNSWFSNSSCYNETIYEAECHSWKNPWGTIGSIEKVF